MNSGTIVFRNGETLILPEGIVDRIATQLDIYWKAPSGERRVYTDSYSADGGSNNRRITIDLESVMYALYA
jgi:hypothetical protein